MRIVGGVARGYVIKEPKIHDLRVAFDYLRKQIFSLIGASIKGETVLDLFAGSGALGLEALSRGALHVDFVDLNEESCRTIARNLYASGLRARARVREMNVEYFVSVSPKERYGIIFFAPPYKNLHLPLLPKALEILKIKGLMFFEHPALLKLEAINKVLTHGYFVDRLLNLGRTHVAIIKKADSG